MKKINLFLVAVTCLFFFSCNKEEITTQKMEVKTVNDQMKVQNVGIQATATSWILYPTWSYSTSSGIPAIKCFAKGSKMVVSVWNYNTSYQVFVKLNYSNSTCGAPSNFDSFYVPINQNVTRTISSWGSSSPNLQVEIRPTTTGSTFTGIVTVSALI